MAVLGPGTHPNGSGAIFCSRLVPSDFKLVYCDPFGPIFGVPAGPRLVFRLVPEPDTDILRPYMVGLAVRYPD